MQILTINVRISEFVMNWQLSFSNSNEFKNILIKIPVCVSRYLFQRRNRIYFWTVGKYVCLNMSFSPMSRLSWRVEIVGKVCSI